MAFDRYSYSDQNINSKIYKKIKNNEIRYRSVISVEGKRLDHYAFEEYGNSNYWWVIAAASGIGWWLQVPPGVVINIPTSIEEIRNLKKI